MWAYVVPPSVMRHAVLLGRDSWMRFNTRSYRALPPRPHDSRVFGEVTLSHHAKTGVSAYAIDPIAEGGGFHLLYGGTVGITLSDEPQLLEVNLVRSNGSPALPDIILLTCCQSRASSRRRSTSLPQGGSYSP